MQQIALISFPPATLFSCFSPPPSLFPSLSLPLCFSLSFLSSLASSGDSDGKFRILLIASTWTLPAARNSARPRSSTQGPTHTRARWAQLPHPHTFPWCSNASPCCTHPVAGGRTSLKPMMHRLFSVVPYFQPICSHQFSMSQLCRTDRKANHTAGLSRCYSNSNVTVQNIPKTTFELSSETCWGGQSGQIH